MQHPEIVQVGQQPVVLGGCLGEAEAGIDDDIVDAGHPGLLHAFREIGQQIGNYVFILRIILHRGRGAVQMHQHVRQLQPSHRGEHVRVVSPAGYIVDDMYAQIGAEPGDARTEGVHRYDQVREFFDNGLERFFDAGAFFGFVREIRSWTGGYAAYIENVHAGIYHLLYPFDSSIRAVGTAEAVKRIRRQVQDAHYFGLGNDIGATTDIEGVGHSVKCLMASHRNPIPERLCKST